ncbi:sugar phosphate nucleotidyltransferase [Niabella drilacis]|uniref:dTDP-glucose pyrophosphorylase n=1 Tax=Niabella drilacis (strain DSM 25811 / CCM 8410 / CCUG 62505 / LMG 26954 / E90) TaxID=1285928 RepID=A0A1G6UVL8_NIADE|nr:sugar phosphate nucleotidyltransferase [Niabella drilacis]SDD45382.1 dTDP-glucose pyrophosphorylase [Niabella drilacis]
MKPTLVILAAGMASRYGSMKQVEAFGPSGETIMDYSIADAISAGFGKIVFLIRKQFEANFRELFASKLDGKVNYEFAFQELDMFLEGAAIPEERTKPWGTGHAVLSTQPVVNEPFAVINADDFYGADAFRKAYTFLTTAADEKTYAVVGYNLMNTLSDHGTVNRGVCGLDANDNLESVVERYNIAEQGDTVISDDGQEPRELSKDTTVSMNFWCFHPSVYSWYADQFKVFIKENLAVPKSEFLIPAVVDHFIKEGGIVKVIKTDAPWFGVTYKEDAPAVQKQLNDLIEKGAYSTNLWG